MNLVDLKADAYAEAHTTPSGELYERLAAETHEKTTAPQMIIPIQNSQTASRTHACNESGGNVRPRPFHEVNSGTSHGDAIDASSLRACPRETPMAPES